MRKRILSRVLLPALLAAGGLLAGATAALLGTCGPFTDTAADSFCPFVQAVFYLGITTGTTPTTYDPTANVTRLQMAAFLSRSVDGVLKRGSRRTALDRFWSPQTTDAIGLTTVGGNPYLCACDGADVWVANLSGNSVSRVRGSDGKLLEAWTAAGAYGSLVAMGRVLVTGALNPAGRLYAIDPSQPAGAATLVSTALGSIPEGLTFDGARVWTANGIGSVSIVTPAASIPWTVTTVAAGFSGPIGAVFDGTNVWVTDFGGKLFKLDAAGGILQTVTVGGDPHFPVFDGTNIWVPNRGSNSVTVVRASSGAVMQTLTGNGLGLPWATAFDGERVIVANNNDTVSLWKAGNLSVIGSIGTGAVTVPNGACSDGVNFWISLHSVSKLARF